MKKVLTAILLSTLFVFSMNTFASAESENIKAQEIVYGLEMDENHVKVLEPVFSEDELKSLTDKGFTLDVITLLVSSGESKEDILKREFVSNSTKHYITTINNPSIQKDYLNLNSKASLPVTSVEEVSYEEYLQRLKEYKERVTIYSDSDKSTTEYKTMTVSVSKKSTGVYTVTNVVDWSTGALNTKEDIIGIGINGNTSPVRGTEYGTQVVRTAVSRTHVQTINYSSSSSKWNRNGDYGLAVDLVDGGVGCIRCQVHKISMMYDIKPNVSSVSLIDAYGHYAHQETTYNVSPSFTISKGVLGISVSQQKDFTIHKPQPHAQMPK
ncbi:hypothetical protein OR571_07970 [Psychrobacillus sp. NEAU-3TGS]|uniref:hypothetical protein n=1 Tax=Psychrobacillus sp. NEAU-3TGS TaxID=2995412 RepID=UPI0024970841|nr:hypothetical protein [Psychrobacillus sp. NEAU-3TGS]MDI2587041.1 hypothetical protein [Psychrobacillus sp. NEAU-3TGS]